MTHLSKDDPRYWHPVPQVVEWLRSQIAPTDKVLEIGPGTVPFPHATTYVDFVEVDTVPADKLVTCNIETERLPFADKSFDFVYCRHGLEDMYNPFHACAEMSRVAKRGYVETPSPLAELCRGADGEDLPYRGYHHHRFIAWAHDGVLQFVSKYPVVEHLKCEEEVLVNTLKSGPRFWNTYYLWNDEIKLKHWQSPLDFGIPKGYPAMLASAVSQSVAATDAFCGMILTGAAAAA